MLLLAPSVSIFILEFKFTFYWFLTRRFSVFYQICRFCDFVLNLVLKLNFLLLKEDENVKSGSNYYGMGYGIIIFFEN